MGSCVSSKSTRQVDDISKQRITVITIATTTPSPSSDESYSDDDLRIINDNISTNVSMETLYLPDDNVTLTNHQPKRLTIIHFNDVYNIEAREKEPVGGAARFKTAIDYHSDKNPLVLFSGDALAPSKMSVVTLGRQMVPVLNMCGVKGAVFGNHDFDHGVDHLIDITHQTEFPWLLTNVVNIHTAGDPLADGQRCVIINWGGVKVGLMGLVEREWLVTLPTVNMEDVQYTDYVTSAKEIIPKLKKKRCDIVIALTHMRVPNDERLAREVPEIDLILGGHDHEYHTDIINDTHLVKSGTDFRTFTELNIQIRHDSKPNITLTKHTITKDIPEDKEMKLVVDEYVEMVQEGLDDVIGRTSCILDGTFKSNRTGETNLGNLITDIMRTSTRSDCAVINSGTFRSDEIHPPGKFKMKDLMSILPMVDPLYVLEIKGYELIEALENGVSQYPKLEGRFPQVSGVSFTFDPLRSPGRRVIGDSVWVAGEPLDMHKIYKLCTKEYLVAGKDGYTIFKSLPVIINEENAPILSNIVRNYFTVQDGVSRGNVRSAISIHSAIEQIATGIINPQIEGRIILYTK